MSSKTSCERRIISIKDGETLDHLDHVTVEAPLEIRCQGRAMATLMRTPGHDLELVRGLCYAEGVLSTQKEWSLIRRVDDKGLKGSERGHVVEIQSDYDWLMKRWPPRSLFATSACGVCGLTLIDHVSKRVKSIQTDLRVSSSFIAGLPDVLRQSQQTFEQTGGLHAAGLFDETGALLVLREDVGRHNAVDKVVGWGLQNGLRFDQSILVVSGRTGYEIIQKAAAAGIPVVASVSAPSSLAIDVAERFRITLCGFVRGQSLNIYSHHSRILG